MKTKYVLLLTVLTFAVSLLSFQACAEGGYVGPQLGIYNAKDADNAQLMGGVAGRILLLPGLGVAASINYRSETYAGGRVSARSWPIMVTALLYLYPGIYGAIGGNWYSTTFTYNAEIIGQTIASETKLQSGWHIGAGLEVPVGKKTKVVGDMRYVFLNYDFKQFPGSSGLSANYYVFMVGVLFGF